MKIRTRGPVKGVDARWAVTLHGEDESPWPPWPITFYFVAVTESEDGTEPEPPTWRIDTKKRTVELDVSNVAEWIHVGFEIGDPLRPDQEVSYDDITPLAAADVEGISTRYVHWLEAARNYLVLDPQAGGKSLLNVRRQKPARLTDEWLRLIASEYERRTREGQSAVSEIAKAHSADVSTASRWVARARERGFIPGKGAA